MVVAMNKDAISIIQQQADTDDKKQKILIVDDSKFNTFGYQYATTVANLWQKNVYRYRDILLLWLFSFSHPLSKIEVFLFFETASLYLVYCLLIVYARFHFQKHKFFYFLKKFYKACKIKAWDDMRGYKKLW